MNAITKLGTAYLVYNRTDNHFLITSWLGYVRGRGILGLPLHSYGKVKRKPSEDRSNKILLEYSTVIIGRE